MSGVLRFGFGGAQRLDLLHITDYKIDIGRVFPSSVLRPGVAPLEGVITSP